MGVARRAATRFEIRPGIAAGSRLRSAGLCPRQGEKCRQLVLGDSDRSRPSRAAIRKWPPPTVAIQPELIAERASTRRVIAIGHFTSREWSRGRPFLDLRRIQRVRHSPGQFSLFGAEARRRTVIAPATPLGAPWRPLVRSRQGQGRLAARRRRMACGSGDVRRRPRLERVLAKSAGQLARRRMGPAIGPGGQSRPGVQAVG